MTMLRLAQKVVRKYDTNDPAQILTEAGVKVFYTPMSGVRGIYKRIKRNSIIFIDSSLDERARRFVLGHELGHHILHRGTNRIFLDRCTYQKTSVAEHQADLFSVCLLAPDPVEILREEEGIDQLACRIGVPQHLVEAYIEELRRNRLLPGKGDGL